MKISPKRPSDIHEDGSAGSINSCAGCVSTIVRLDELMQPESDEFEFCAVDEVGGSDDIWLSK